MSTDHEDRIAGRVYDHFCPVLMDRWIDRYSVSLLETDPANAAAIEPILQCELNPRINPLIVTQVCPGRIESSQIRKPRRRKTGGG